VSELRLTLLVEYVGAGDRPAAPLVREIADCADAFALVHELDDTGLALARFRASISESFLDGARDLDVVPTAG
jgi:hypothetical protein